MQQYRNLMNKWSLTLLVLCISAVVCQQEESAEDQQYLGMRRTACLVLSRYHSNTQKDTIESVVQGLTPELQQQYINKIYSTAVETCEPLINQSEVQELFVENPDFDPTHLFHLFEAVDYSTLADTLDTPLTSNQQNIVKFIKQFDEEMEVRREEREAQKAASGQASQQNDIKMFGISFHKLSGFTKFLYAAVFFALVAGALFWGFQKLDNKDQKKNTKRKKSPKKD